jgi:hypothetical protein
MAAVLLTLARETRRQGDRVYCELLKHRADQLLADAEALEAGEEPLDTSGRESAPVQQQQQQQHLVRQTVPTCKSCNVAMRYYRTYPAKHDSRLDDHIYRCEECKAQASVFEERE